MRLACFPSIPSERDNSLGFVEFEANSACSVLTQSVSQEYVESGHGPEPIRYWCSIFISGACVKAPIIPGQQNEIQCGVQKSNKCYQIRCNPSWKKLVRQSKTEKFGISSIDIDRQLDLPAPSNSRMGASHAHLTVMCLSNCTVVFITDRIV